MVGLSMTHTLRRGLAAAAAVLMVATGCAGRESGSAPAPSPRAEASFDPALAGRLDATIADAMSSATVPGALVGIWTPGGDYVKALGVADTATGIPMKTDFYSRIGSVTKTFTATAVLQLVDDGKIRLDDPIARYLDGVPNGEAITVRQLLTMRSGLADYTKVDGFDTAVAANPQREFTPRELLGWSFSQPAQFLPGGKFQYSNTNYIVLGLLVEKIGGKQFGAYLTERILAPLGMVHTSFPTGAQFPDPHAKGYTDPVDDDRSAVDATDWSASFTWAAGAMISTLDDMHTWAPALATGALLSPDLQQQRLRIIPDPGDPGDPGDPADFGYGMGVFTVAGWIGHNGSVPGYQTAAVYLPQREITLVVTINTDIAPPGGDPSGAMVTAITSVLTPDHVYKL